MAITNRMNGRAMTIPGGVLLGAGTALAWTIMMAIVLAKLIEIQTLREEAVGYGSMVILLSAPMLGSGIAWRNVKRQLVLVCLSTGAAYLLILMAITAFFFGGQYEAVGVTTALVGTGSAVVILMGMREQKSIPGKYRKKLH